MTAPTNAATDRVAQAMSGCQRMTGIPFKHARFRTPGMAEVDMHKNPHNELNDSRLYGGTNVAYNSLINGFEEIQATRNLGRKTARKHYNVERRKAAEEVIKGFNGIITTGVSSGVQWLADNWAPTWFLSDEYGCGQTYLSLIPILSYVDHIEHPLPIGTKTAITNFAHFLNPRSSTLRTNENGSSYSAAEESAIIALVATLVSNNACDTGHIETITGYHAQNSILKRVAGTGGWDPENLEATARISTVQYAQSSERKVIIFGLTKRGLGLQHSLIVGGPLVNVASSRAEDMFLVIGHWRSVERLSADNWLRRTMMAYQTNNPNFVLDVGSAPFGFEHEREIEAGAHHEQPA
ncbi:hypothetical protein H2200_007157 [Cladophialophora chaetospira]|uniref:DNA2/NAM7 helicase-like C-terminal domain-containing protein n=1 Tax=Cladophialophora chaetospira TaxID=386627 RepID=A0AA38X7D0_9EURO|nr:hypothetical protein H2200_007157 [Cladophialophora chaetospira]